MAKYGYVEVSQDERTHQPVLHKQDEKKLVRYRDNQVVSTKGERFSLVKQEESEEVKKTYVNIKPARKYRFHWFFILYTELGWTEPEQKTCKPFTHMWWQETCTVRTGELNCSLLDTDLTSSSTSKVLNVAKLKAIWDRAKDDRALIVIKWYRDEKDCFWGQLIDNKSPDLMNLGHYRFCNLLLSPSQRWNTILILFT